MLLSFVRPEPVLATNIEMGQTKDETLTRAGEDDWLRQEAIVAGYHVRGSDELLYKALKGLGFEQMLFKRFAPNWIFYCTMLMSLVLYEVSKQDVCTLTMELVCYANTLCRRV